MLQRKTELAQDSNLKSVRISAEFSLLVTGRCHFEPVGSKLWVESWKRVTFIGMGWALLAYCTHELTSRLQTTWLISTQVQFSVQQWIGEDEVRRSQASEKGSEVVPDSRLRGASAGGRLRVLLRRVRTSRRRQRSHARLPSRLWGPGRQGQLPVRLRVLLFSCELGHVCVLWIVPWRNNLRGQWRLCSIIKCRYENDY